MRTKNQFNVRPIAMIAKKYAKKSFQVGTFGASEGYEIVRLCFDDQVKVEFNPATLGSQFNATKSEESITYGVNAIKKIAQDLSDAGYKVEFVTNLELKVQDKQ